MSLIWFTFFFFNDTATTEIYTLSLHDALPIYRRLSWPSFSSRVMRARRESIRRSTAASLWDVGGVRCDQAAGAARSEEHTSELQSQSNLVCRLLLEKKNKTPP